MSEDVRVIEQHAAEGEMKEESACSACLLSQHKSSVGSRPHCYDALKQPELVLCMGLDQQILDQKVLPLFSASFTNSFNQLSGPPGPETMI